MRISRDELRRQSVVTKTSLTVAGLLWCATFGLLVLFDDFGAPAMLFWVCLALCGLSFLYVAAAVLVTWAYDSGKNGTGPSAFFDGWNPLKRMVVRDAIKRPPTSWSWRFAIQSARQTSSTWPGISPLTCCACACAS